jgi:hypothetical protein
MKPQTKTAKSAPKLIFRLQNGLNATLLGPKSPAMKRLLNACTNKDTVDFVSDSLYAVEVEVDGERTYVVYDAKILGLWWKGESDASKYIVRMIQSEMEKTLRDNWVVIYNNVAYPFNSKMCRALVNAIIHKVKPGLAALVTP